MKILTVYALALVGMGAAAMTHPKIVAGIYAVSVITLVVAVMRTERRVRRTRMRLAELRDRETGRQEERRTDLVCRKVLGW